MVIEACADPQGKFLPSSAEAQLCSRTAIVMPD
jgi:hypothetical protein